MYYMTNNAILIAYHVIQGLLSIITLVLQDIERSEKDLSTTQMLKGILDGCLLAIIKNKEVYGYELAEKLESYGFHSFSEGTIYPLLMRMQKEELVTSTLKKSTAGPRRKYYSLTPKGEEELKMFMERWNYLQTNVNRVLHHESDTKHAKGDETVE
ncbi:Putative DNA-binding protein YizB [Bacillus sonorensis]|uniref:DNA-binding protein YizB n=2 Tax=Bacillaceae TaxID=186817 RepID=A0ABM6LIU7_9BACI|nr:Putative DNA-binding protein YizB [Bacillus sonorensis]GIN68433.1 hypothetical protein J41TS2_38540 [Bacillus sonorensis]